MGLWWKKHIMPDYAEVELNSMPSSYKDIAESDHLDNRHMYDPWFEKSKGGKTRRYRKSRSKKRKK